MAMTPFGARGTLGTVADTTISSGGASNRIITNIILSNYTASAVTVNIKLAGKYIIGGSSLPANSSVSFDCRQYLSSAEVVAGWAGTGTAVDYQISGVTVT